MGKLVVETGGNDAERCQGGIKNVKGLQEYVKRCQNTLSKKAKKWQQDQQPNNGISEIISEEQDGIYND